MVSFFIQFIVVNFLFSSIIYLFFERLNTNKEHASIKLFLYSLGLGPAITSLFLYYLLWLIPGQGDGFYFSVILMLFATIFAVNYKQAQVLISNIYGKFGSIFKNNWLFFLALIPYAGLGFVWIISQPVLQHDLLEYLVQAKIFYKNKAITYSAHHYDQESMFYYVGLHGFTFPLIDTWSSIWDSFVGESYGGFVKSVTTYYGLLIITLQYYWLKKVNKLMALFTTGLMFLTYGFFLTSIIVFHLDMFRIFFFLLMFITTLEMIEKTDRLQLVLLGTFGGTAAMIHSTGMFFMFISFVTLLLFLKGDVLKERIPKIFFSAVVFLFAGGLHYFIDIFWGTGWIFKTIKFY